MSPFQGMEHNKKKYQLPDLMGYRGIEVYHTTGNEYHHFVIPKCKFLQLEYLLINRTSGNAMTAAQKSHVFQALRVCIDKQKTDKRKKTEIANGSTKKP